jgi:hypothetical protein
MADKTKFRVLVKRFVKFCGSNLHGRSFGCGSQKREPSLRGCDFLPSDQVGGGGAF